MTGAKHILIASSALWALAMGAGFWLIWSYQNTPGTASVPPSRWPANSQIQRSSSIPTLVMIAHPRCSCTRASIGELALLMAHCQGRVSAYVLFLKPRDFPEGWERTDLWDSAARIPGVSVVSDDGGLESGRFNAETSGATVLYDADGSLLFSGGITESRGHSGDNEGRSAIVALLNREPSGLTKTKVFGCSIVDVKRACSKEE